MPSLLRKLATACSQWRARKRAWLGQDIPQPDGLSVFQHQAVAALREAFEGIEVSRIDAREPYLCGSLRGTDASFFIYRDEAQFQSSTVDWRAERWDFENPACLIAALVQRGRELGCGG